MSDILLAVVAAALEFLVPLICVSLWVTRPRCRPVAASLLGAVSPMLILILVALSLMSLVSSDSSGYETTLASVFLMTFPAYFLSLLVGSICARFQQQTLLLKRFGLSFLLGGAVPLTLIALSFVG